MSSETQYATSY